MLACAVTEADLRLVGQTPPLLVRGLSLRPSLVATMPQSEPLAEEFERRAISTASADEMLCRFMAAHSIEGRPPLGARYAWLVREAIQSALPSFAALFHYRNIDLVTISTLLEMWYPHVAGLAQLPSSDPSAAIDQDLAWLRTHRSETFVLASEPVAELSAD